MISGEITYEITKNKENSLSKELDLNLGSLSQLLSQVPYNCVNNYTEKILSNKSEHASSLKIHRTISRTLSQKRKSLSSYIDFKLSILDKQFAQIETKLLEKKSQKRKDTLDVYYRTTLSIQKMIAQFTECCLQNERINECSIMEKKIMRRLRKFSLRIGYESRGDIKLLNIPVSSREFDRHEQAMNNYFIGTEDNQFSTCEKKLKVIAVFKIKNCAIQTMFRQSLESTEQTTRQEVRGLYYEVPIKSFEEMILFAGGPSHENMDDKCEALQKCLFQNERNEYIQTSFGLMNDKKQSPIGLSCSNAFSKKRTIQLKNYSQIEAHSNSVGIVMLSLCRVLLKYQSDATGECFFLHFAVHKIQTR